MLTSEAEELRCNPLFTEVVERLKSLPEDRQRQFIEELEEQTGGEEYEQREE